MPEERMLAAIAGLDVRAARLDTRMTRVEKLLPDLATRDDLRAAVAPLPTREEMHAAIAAAIAPLATREELERARLSTNVLIDDLKDDNRVILEHLIALSNRVDALARR